MMARFYSVMRCHGGLILAFIVIVLAALSLSDLMRESDQASILAGALDLTWGGELVGNSAYRYDKFFGTYWILASGFHLNGVTVGDDPHGIVLFGNVLALVFYGAGLLILASRLKLRAGLLGILTVALISPVLLFSSALLSPNIFSVAFLWILLAAWRSNSCKFQTIWISIAAFISVSCRLDAVLVMPIFSLLATRRSIWLLWSDRRVVGAFCGSVAALAVSYVVGVGHERGIGENFFFDEKITAAYCVFGLLASLGFYLLFAIGTVLHGKKNTWWMALAVLMPFLFYVGLLFTPRHLILIPVVLVASVVLPQGKRVWRELLGLSWSRVIIGAGFVISIGLFFFGVKLTSLKNPQVCFKDATYYPTADGYWPMGASFSFLKKLSCSGGLAIDHNQEVWRSWCNYNFKEGDRVLWDSLYRYPQLVAKLQGKTLYTSHEVEGAVISERALRRNVSYLERDCLLEMIDTGEKSITYISKGSMGLMRMVSKQNEMKNDPRLLAATFAEGNDFILVQSSDPLLHQKVMPLRGNRAFVMNEIKGSESESGWHIELYDWDQSEIDLKKADWVGVLRLPDYMSIQAYGKK